MLTFGSLFFLLRDSIFDAGIGWFYFSLQAVMSFALGVFGTIFSAQTLFTSRDNELLMSMPIKPWKILISRLLVVLAFEYAFEAIISVPAFIIWVMGGYATPIGVLYCLAGYTLLPLMALTIACFLAWMLSSIIMRIKRKNVITLGMSLSILLLYLRLYAQLQNYLNTLLGRGVEISEAFRRAIPPLYAFGAGIVNRSLMDFAEFMCWAIIPFALMVAVMMSNYRKILTTNKGTAKIVYKEKAVKASGACLALTKKELAHYISKPTVVLNTSISSVFMLIGAGAMFVKRAEALSYLERLSSLLGDVPHAAIAAAALAVMCCMNNLSASLISLEGRHLWIAKTIPVHPKVIFLSKLYTHMLSSAFPCLAASVSAAFLTAGSISDFLLIIVFPQTFILLSAVAGLVINLLFPRFDWTSETQPVKQGAAAMITLFGSMALITGVFMSYIFVIRRYIGVMAFGWIVSAVFAGAAFVLWRWLSGAGAKRLMKISGV
jgi:ABC-2 type transport system permease protein